MIDYLWDISSSSNHDIIYFEFRIQRLIIFGYQTEVYSSFIATPFSIILLLL